MSLTAALSDPDKLLNEWLYELENLIGGLEISTSQLPSITLRPPSQSSSERTDSYRFSMANLEETHEAELDAILGELSLLECKNNDTTGTTTITGTTGIIGTGVIGTGTGTGITTTTTLRPGRQHIRTNSIISTGLTNSIISTISSSDSSGIHCNSSENNHEIIINRESRTDSPDNDSAFSDTVSLLSSESSASSGVSTAHLKNLPNLSQCDSAKAAKIHLALQKLEQASVRRLFVKAFTSDGASKSLLVDERMTCGHVTRLLSDKNHVQMEPNWSLVEHLTDLHMERLYEDHELLVDSLMLWSRDSKNRVMFLQRPDKIALFNKTERFLSGTQMAPGSEHDEHTRSMLLDEFFTTGGQVAMEGPLYLKTDSRKGWKRYHFVLRASGLYYFPKEKTKSTRDLICLNSFVGYEVYKGIGWKKKYKSPTDFTFALRSPSPTSNSKTARLIKMMCAEDADTLEKWVTNIRIAKYGKRVFDNHRVLLEDLARDELDKLSSARSGSIVSIISSVPSQLSTGSNNTSGSSNNSLPIQNGRLSRASSSSSSGCLSDDNNGFDCEFPTGTIKRKPSMKPNLPLTSMTRQLKEVGETTMGISDNNLLISPTSPERGGTLTRRHSRRRSEESNNSGTLKRRQTSSRGSIESMNSSSSPSTLTPTPSTPGTPCGTNRSIFTTTTQTNINNNNNNNNNKLTSTTINYISPMESMPSCMTDSVFSLPPPPEDLSLSASMMSLDSLPPPPPPNELLNDFSGSSMSLASLPPPPPIDIKPMFVPASSIIEHIEPLTIVQSQPIYASHPEPPMIQHQQQIYSKTLKTSSLKSPPYKLPPQYNGSNGTIINGSTTLPTKSVSFADSPVLLRRKVCFDDQVQIATISRNSSRDSIAAPVPPPRAEATRLSVSPKRLSDSVCNPPRDFLKDLQRVMRKKWQVAQKCKLEPATTPHEVLGFRDFNELAQSSNYYAESANVSNWVQEHYGSNCLYENLGGAIVSDRMSVTLQQQQQQQPLPPTPVKKRPPPPPPKRSESTQLTNRSQ